MVGPRILPPPVIRPWEEQREELNIKEAKGRALAVLMVRCLNMCFILGFKYSKAKKNKCQLMNFIIGQSKLAVYISRKKKVEDGVDTDVVALLSKLIRARILIDLIFYKQMKDLENFMSIWTFGGVLCSVQGSDLVFAEQLVYFFLVPVSCT